MDYYTIGRSYYENDRVPISVTNSFEQGVALKDGLRLIFIKSGSGVIDNGIHQMSFLGPILYCVGYQEAISISSDEELTYRVVNFHPKFINSSFDFDNLMNRDEDIKFLSETRDRYWLFPFLERHEFQGIVGLGPYHTERVIDLIYQIEDELTVQRDWYWPCRTRSFFIELLFILERCFMDKEHYVDQRLPREETMLETLTCYLNEHYMDKITIEHLTKQFSINRTSLNNLFKEAENKTVIQYLVDLRVKMASMLLKNTELQISEILYRVGFNDTAHFNRTFKRHLGLPPKTYREQNSVM